MTILTRSRLVPGVLIAVLCFVLGQLCFTTPVTQRADLLIAGIGLHLLGALLAARSIYRADTMRDTAVTVPWWLPAIVVLLGAALRLIWLDRLSLRIDGDATAFALGATIFLQPKHPPLIGTGWQSHTNLYLWLVSLPMHVFGHSVWSVRILSAIGGSLGVLAIWALGRLWNPRVALLAALAAAVLPFHLVFSRVGTEVVHLTWQLPLAIVLLWHGWHTRAWYWLALGGAIVGLSQYFYPGARLIPLLSVAQIGLMALDAPRERRWRRAIWALLIVGAAFTLVYSPMIGYYLRHPDIYTARLKLVSITSTGWLDRQLETRPIWRVMGEQMLRAAIPFHYPIGDGSGLLWWLWPQYLGPLDAALLSLGLIGVWLGRDTPRWLRHYLLLNIVGAIILGGVLTIDTPMPSRYMVLIPAVIVLIGYALDLVIQHMLALIGSRRRLVASSAIVGLLIGYGLGNLSTYLRHDTQAVWESDSTNQTATLAARYLQQQPDQDYQIVFLSTGYIYFKASPTLAFLTAKTGVDLKEPLSCATLQPLIRAPRTVLIAAPDRIDELRAFQARVRSHELAVLRNPRGQEVTAILSVPAAHDGDLPCSGP